jgi:hypothetical protein
LPGLQFSVYWVGRPVLLAAPELVPVAVCEMWFSGAQKGIGCSGRLLAFVLV